MYYVSIGLCLALRFVLWSCYIQYSGLGMFCLLVSPIIQISVTQLHSFLTNQSSETSQTLYINKVREKYTVALIIYSGIPSIERVWCLRHSIHPLVCLDICSYVTWLLFKYCIKGFCFARISEGLHLKLLTFASYYYRMAAGQLATFWWHCRPYDIKVIKVKSFINICTKFASSYISERIHYRLLIGLFYYSVDAR